MLEKPTKKHIRESIGSSRKDGEKVIAKKKTEIVENKFLDVRKDPDPITFHAFTGSKGSEPMTLIIMMVLCFRHRHRHCGYGWIRSFQLRPQTR